MSRLACLALAAGCAHAAAPPANQVARDEHLDVTLAVVMSGAEIWIGNDKLVPAGDPSQYAGALGAVKQAFDAAELSHVGAAAQGMLVTYADRAQVKVPLGPLANLTGAAFGTQKDYFGTVGSELVAGTSLALAALHTATTGRRMLVVLGDGNDTNNEAARTELAKLRDQATGDHIEVVAIIYRSPLSADGDVVSVLTGNVIVAGTVDTLRQALGRVFDRVRAR